MSLFLRITGQGATKILVHRFGAALRQWASGQLTRAQVIAAFSLSAAEIIELDALKATYDALGTGTAAAAFLKAQYLGEMEDVFLLCETGDYDETKAKSALGF